MMSNLSLFSIAISILIALIGEGVKRVLARKKQFDYLGLLVPAKKVASSPQSFSKLKPKMKFSIKAFDRLMIWFHQRYDVPKDISLPNLVFIHLGLLFICWNISGFLKTSFLPLVLLAFFIEIIVALLLLQKRRLIDRLDKSFPQLLDSIASVYQIHPDLKQSLEYSKNLVIDPTSKRFLTEVDQMNRVGLPIIQSLEMMASKWQYAPLSFLISSIKLHQSSGGNLAYLFRQTAESSRRQQRNKKEMQSVMFQNKVSSLVVCSLVPIILLLSLSFSQSYRSVVFTEPLARSLIIAAGVWWCIGVVVMWRALRVRV